MTESRGNPGRRHATKGLVAGVTVLAGLLALAPRAVAKTPLIESRWQRAEAMGAGSDASATTLEKGRVAVVAANDDRFLYLTLTTHDRALYFSMFRNGMTLWIDPDGGHRKTIGIRYPLGIEGGGAEGAPAGPPPPGPRASDRGRDEERATKPLVPPAQVLEILGPNGDDPRRVLAGDVPGLDVQVGDDEETFTYRLKVPLAAANDRSVGVGAAIGETIGVGWVTSKPRSEGPSPDERGGREGMGGPRGGMGGPRGGGMGGPMAGGMGGDMGGGMEGEMGGGRSGGRHRGGIGGPEGRGDQPKAASRLDLWVKVRLAALEARPLQQLAGD